MIRVRAPSRLHFGLFQLAAEEPGSEPALPIRRFGGVGLMVQAPGIELEARPAPTWSAEGPLAERALAFARRFVETFPAGTIRPHHIRIARAAPEHVGLGTGTQLGLAVASALAKAANLPGLEVIELARRVGRGLRSALGIHGFGQGGLLVDGGLGPTTTVAPLVARADFPEAWRVVLILPTEKKGLHGDGESAAFRNLGVHGSPRGHVDFLCRIVLLGMLPALAEGDLDTFGEALHEFNRRVGETFAPAQGGPYFSARMAEWVAFLRQQGIRGVGQSSWGPTVFTVVENEEHARDLVERMGKTFELDQGEILFTPACNRGGYFSKDSTKPPSE